MNIYELEKQATPGPLMHRGEGTLAFDDGHCRIIYHRASTKKQDAATAALLAHCRNNFMRALEALQQANDRIKAEHGWCVSSVGHLDDCAVCEQARENDALIAELEEVK